MCWIHWGSFWKFHIWGWCQLHPLPVLCCRSIRKHGFIHMTFHGLTCISKKSWSCVISREKLIKIVFGSALFNSKLCFFNTVSPLSLFNPFHWSRSISWRTSWVWRLRLGWRPRLESTSCCCRTEICCSTSPCWLNRSRSWRLKCLDQT